MITWVEERFGDELAGLTELANRYRALHGEDVPLVPR